jgi:hypothetical protein
MNTPSLTRNEETALLSNLSVVDLTADARSGAEKSITHFTATIINTGGDLSDVLCGVYKGLKTKGDRTLMQVLYQLSHYLNSWVILVMLAFSIYGIVDASSSAYKTISAWIKKLSGWVGALGSLNTMLFKDEATNQGDPSGALGFITTMVSAEVPMFGALLATVPRTASDVVYEMPGSATSRHDAAYDAAYDHSSKMFAAAVAAGADPGQLQTELERVTQAPDEDDRAAMGLFSDIYNDVFDPRHA